MRLYAELMYAGYIALPAGLLSHLATQPTKCVFLQWFIDSRRHRTIDLRGSSLARLYLLPGIQEHTIMTIYKCLERARSQVRNRTRYPSFGGHVALLTTLHSHLTR